LASSEPGDRAHRELSVFKGPASAAGNALGRKDEGNPEEKECCADKGPCYNGRWTGGQASEDPWKGRGYRSEQRNAGERIGNCHATAKRNCAGELLRLAGGLF
jgi:hypothetical protein